MFEQHFVDLRVKSFDGLLGMAKMSVIFFTATLSDYWRKIAMTVFDLQEAAIMTFPTAKFLRDGYE